MLFCVHLELSMAVPRCSGGGTSAEEMHLTLARVVLAAAAGLTRGARRQARADMGKKFCGPTVNSGGGWLMNCESKTRGASAAATATFRGSVQYFERVSPYLLVTT